MQGSQLEVLKGCLHCLQLGESVSLVSVVQTWGTSPRPVGSLLAVSSSGRFYGSVSGGCVEEDLIEVLTQQPSDQIKLMMYGETSEQRHRFGLPCGGALQLVVEPFNNMTEVNKLISAIENRHTFIRSSNLSSQCTEINGWTNQDPVLKNNIWTNVFGPTWRLLVIGAGETGRYLAEMGMGLGYDILVSDPRPEYRKNWPLTQINLLDGFPDDIIANLNVDCRTAIVAVAHDPKVDDMALLTALKSNAFYVGALGSKLNNQQRRERLIEHFDFNQEQVDRLHGPVGLNIGSKTPPEIALSILAEITAIKNGVSINKAMESKSNQLSDTPACSL